MDPCVCHVEGGVLWAFVAADVGVSLDDALAMEGVALIRAASANVQVRAGSRRVDGRSERVIGGVLLIAQKDGPSPVHGHSICLYGLILSDIKD